MLGKKWGKKKKKKITERKKGHASGKEKKKT